MESLKIVLMNLSVVHQWRSRHREQICAYGEDGEGEVGQTERVSTGT